MTNPFETIEERLSSIESLIHDLKKQPDQTSLVESSECWFNLSELCIYIPDKPAKPTVYGWVHSGTIPYHKGKKKLRFLKSEIDEWLKSGKHKSNAEIEQEAEAYLSNNKKGLK